MTRPGFEPVPPRWEAGDYYLLFLFIYLVCEAIGTAATPGAARAVLKRMGEVQSDIRVK
jgi:hypothetical protein